MKSGIYLIKNIVNNKVYVGSAVNVDKRWSQHKNHLKRGKHHSCHLQSAWDKYGEQTFTFDILELVSNPEHLLAYEQVYLDYYKSYENDRGYNICKVAGSQFGMKRSEEARRKMSEAHTGLKRSEETKKKKREAQKCRIFSEETKLKIGEASKNRSEEAKKKIAQANIGRKLSEEHKQKLREANIGKKISEEAKQKIREIKTGVKRSEETKRKLREAHIGKKASEETIAKMREAQRKSNNKKYYYFNKQRKKYLVRIWGKFVGWYNTEEEAKQSVVINLEKLKAEQTLSP